MRIKYIFFFNDVFHYFQFKFKCKDIGNILNFSIFKKFINMYSTHQLLILIYMFINIKKNRCNPVGYRKCVMLSHGEIIITALG